jgi:hypothetical protein
MGTTSKETLQVVLHKRTEKAVLVSTDGKEPSAVWLPLGQIEIEDGAAAGDGVFYDVIAPVWLLENRGLI